MMGKFGKEIIENAKEAIAIDKGNANPASRNDVNPVDMGTIRGQLLPRWNPNE